MSTPENGHRMTRRDLLRAGLIAGGVTGTMALTAGSIDFLDKNRIRLEELEAALNSGGLKYAELEAAFDTERLRNAELEAALNSGRLKYAELEAALYFERLRNTILNIQIGKDKYSEFRRDIYLGNVNDFDRGKRNVSRGSVVFYSRTGQEVISTIPNFITDIPNKKKSNVKIIYLDSGTNHPYRSRFNQDSNQILDNLRKLMPGIDISLALQDTMSWNPNNKVYFNGVTGNVEEDKVRDGKFRLSDDYRYLFFAERPLNAYYEGFLKGNETSGGLSIIQNNIAVVNLFNYKSGGQDIFKAALQEIGHSYGLDHCWENDCAMSYKAALGHNTPNGLPTGFGPRCSMIGRNIASGHIEQFGDPLNPSAYFASARLIPEDVARKDFENHLINYLSDMGGPIPQGLMTSSTLSRDGDIIKFSNPNKALAALSVNSFISAFTTI